MKSITRTLFLAIALLCNCGAYSQDFPKELPQDLPKPGGYGKNENLQKFVGAWQWQSGDSIFIIKLEKFKNKVKSGGLKGYSYDAIIGWHRFMVGDQVIESSLEHEGSSYEQRTFTILGGGEYVYDKSHLATNSLTIKAFKDLSKYKLGRATLELLPGEKDKARWTLKETPGVKILGVGEKPDNTFTVPTNVIMERVKEKNK